MKNRNSATTDQKDYFARKSTGLAKNDYEVGIDMARMRAYRLNRVREQLKQRDYGACVLFDPINIRYATGTRNMQVWTLHNPARYAFVPAEGSIVLFDFHGCEHLTENLETIGEVRPTTTWFYFNNGPKMYERAKLWAAEIADLVRERCGGNKRLALDHCDPLGAKALEALGIDVVDAQEPLEHARVIKSPDELACMNISVAVCDVGIARMREALRPGLTEWQIWSILHQTNIELGGEWVECHLLSSGGRTNPWWREASDRIIRPGDLVAFDTDLIGPLGYGADISRTFFCGPGKPNAEQRRLYSLAVEQIHYNLDLVKPGIGFREFTERAMKLPPEFIKNRYSAIAHGVGLSNEYPCIWYPEDFPRIGYDGALEENMTICFESYIGEDGGAEGVKLEQQVVITKTGYQLLSTFPFEEQLMT
jgi:Xaa-Pro dipeptidase